MTSDQRNDEQVATSRATTDFTIDHILNRAGHSSHPSNSSSSHCQLSVNSFLPFPRIAEPEVNLVFARSTKDITSYANDKCYQQAQELNDSFEGHQNGLPFTWLQCTRYCPPKVPRKKEGPQKRQLGRHPRIPFTSHQLSILEDKFKQSPYLSSEEVTKLSRILDLADIRVKIWFQNRRARERREKLNSNSSTSPSRSSPPSSPTGHLHESCI